MLRKCRSAIEPNVTACPAVSGRNGGLGHLDRAQDPSCVRQKCFALGRERQSPRRAMDQLHTEPVLQPGDDARHARGGQADLGTDCRERTEIDRPHETSGYLRCLD